MMGRKLVGGGVEGFCGGVGVQVCVSKRGGCRAWVCGREEYSRNIYLERLGGVWWGGRGCV